MRLDVFRRALIEGDARNLLVLFLCPPRPVLFAPANRVHTLVALDYGGRLRHAVTTNIDVLGGSATADGRMSATTMPSLPP